MARVEDCPPAGHRPCAWWASRETASCTRWGRGATGSGWRAGRDFKDSLKRLAPGRVDPSLRGVPPEPAQRLREQRAPVLVRVRAVAELEPVVVPAELQG